MGTSNSRAFRWRPGQGVQVLPTTKGFSTEANAVNNLDVIAGTIATDTGLLTARWTHGKGPHILPEPTFGPLDVPPTCQGFGINRAGEIVGRCFGTSDPSFSAYAWDWAGNVFTVGGFPPPVTFQGYASAISSTGFITGEARDFDRAFLARPNGTSVVLPNLDPANTTAVGFGSAVNDRGQVAGASPKVCRRATAWLDTLTATDLGTCGAGNGIDMDAVVAGTGVDSTGNGPAFAFVWHKGQGLRRLPGLGGSGETSEAIAINRSHEVLGRITSGGVQHTVIWTLPGAGTVGGAL